MRDEIYLEILYQLNLIGKLISKERDIIKISRYKGIEEALLYILSLEEKI